MGRLFPFKKPVFTLSCPPFGEVRARACRKIIFDEIVYFLSGGGTDHGRLIKEIAVDKLPDNISLATAAVFLNAYRNAVEEYCEENIDIFGIPRKLDFEEHEKIKLPVITASERLVHEHSGLDLFRINELDILDYRLLLADSVKLNILERADGKGKEYLNECYDCMHKNSDIFG